MAWRRWSGKGDARVGQDQPTFGLGGEKREGATHKKKNPEGRSPIKNKEREKRKEV